MNSIYLNQRHYQAEEILSYTKEELRRMPLFLQEIFEFLQDWFGAAPFIEVKTSGSTGEPKLIRLSKLTMLNSAKATNHYFSLHAGDAILLCLSARYIAGKMMLVRAIVGQLQIHAIEPSAHPDLCQYADIQLCAMVPMQVEEILRCQDVTAFDPIKTLIIGGAPVQASLEIDLQRVSSRCFATYGMTETASHVALRAINGIKSKIGYYEALPHVRFSTDGRGCLIVSAPELIDEPLVTNDVVELLSETRFAWKGRYDFMLNSGGIKLFPEVIEKKIYSAINRPFYLTKRSDDRLGEALVLVLEGEPLRTQDQQNLINEIIRLVGKYEKPREIRYLKQFQYTSTGKLMRILPV